MYFFEHPERELETAVLVAARLKEQFGRRVVITHSSTEAYRSLHSFRPRLVVVPYLYSATSFPASIFREMYGAGVSFTNLCYEQILGGFFETPKRPRDHFVKEEVFHCAWNDDFGQWLEGHGVKHSQIAVTGSPQHAIYADKYGFFKTGKPELARQCGLDPERGWVVIPMNYAGAFFAQEAIDARIIAGFPADKMGPYLEFCRKSLSVTLDWILEAADRFPDKLFVIRPRPAEDEVGYRRLLLQKRSAMPENLHVVKRLAVRHWILASEAVFSSYSTTLLDAAFAGKPVYSLAPIPIPEWLTGGWNHLVPPISTQEELTNVIGGSVDSSISSELTSYTDHVFGVTLGDPIQRIASLINRLLDEGSGDEVRRRAEPKARTRARFHVAMKLRSIQEGILDFLGKRGIGVSGTRQFIAAAGMRQEIERLTRRLPSMDSRVSH